MLILVKIILMITYFDNNLNSFNIFIVGKLRIVDNKNKNGIEHLFNENNDNEKDTVFELYSNNQ